MDSAFPASPHQRGATWTGRARLRAAIDGRTADRVAWSPLLGGYFERGLPRKLAGKSTLEYLRLVDADLLLRMGSGGIPGAVRARRHEVRVREEPAGGPDGVRVTVYETPRGALRGTQLPDEQAQTAWRHEFPVKTVADYDALECLWEDLSYEPNHEALGAFLARLGDEGFAIVGSVDHPLVALFRHRDQEHLLYDLADYPERMRRLLDRIHRRQLEGFALLAEGPGEAFIQGCSYIGTALVSPALYERWVLPYLQDYTALLHRHGKKLFAHMCGAIWDLLDLAQRAGLDGIESVAPPPVGNTPIGAALDRVGPQFCLIGGVDPVLLATAAPERVRAHAREILEQAAGHPNFILGSGDAVAAGTTLEQLWAVSQAVRDVYGGPPVPGT